MPAAAASRRASACWPPSAERPAHDLRQHGARRAREPSTGGKDGPLATIALMTHASVHDDVRARRRASARWMRLVILAVTLVGLVFMHQLAGPPAAHHHADDSATAPAAVPCEHPDDCPDDPHGHPGQVCQAKPPSSTTLIPAPPLALTPRPAPSPSTVTPSTADHYAAGGSGCGPPGRAHLSIWRI